MFHMAAFSGSSLLVHNKNWKKPTKVSDYLFCIVKKIHGLINTLGCVIIHYSVLQLVNIWHGENEMPIYLPSILMLISSGQQQSCHFHLFKGGKRETKAI